MRLCQILAQYEATARPKVYVTCSSQSDALFAVTDAAVLSPVIAHGDNSAATTAFAAAKMFGLYDSAVRQSIQDAQLRNARRLLVDDAELRTQSLPYMGRINRSLENNEQFFETSLQIKKADGTVCREDDAEKTKCVGKVRDRYTTEKACVLVTTDRLTGFDRPLGLIPFKGQVLNLTSRWWFEHTKDIVNNHVLDASSHPNVTIGRRCKPFPIEFVMRGYITGSSGTALWTHYNKGVRRYCGHDFPDGMVKNQKLETNLLTPTTKCDEHDELIDAETIVKDKWMTKEDWEFCAEKAKAIFARGQKLAAEHGLILVDTKYEFGRDEETGEILLIDEIHTPDSSRYWVAASYEQNMRDGKSPENIDKEFVRRWFVAKDGGNCDPYDNSTPLPKAPNHLLAELSRRYIQLYEMITGETFQFTDASKDIDQSVNGALDSLGLSC